MKPSFNKSAQNWLSTPQKAFPATEVAGENSGPRHGNHHVRLPFLRKTRTRNPGLLAPVLLQGIRPLSAGTALYARSGPGLARQAQGGVASGSVDGRRNPGRQGGQVAGAFITTDGLSRTLSLLRPLFSPRALARSPIARDHGTSPDGIFLPSSSLRRTFP